MAPAFVFREGDGAGVVSFGSGTSNATEAFAYPAAVAHECGAERSRAATVRLRRAFRRHGIVLG